MILLPVENEEIRGNVESVVINIDGQENNEVFVENDAVHENVETVVEGNVKKQMMITPMRWRKFMMLTRMMIMKRETDALPVVLYDIT